MYDPTVGRWTAEDPKGFAAGSPDLYEYTFNSPTNYTDPSGLDVFDWLYKQADFAAMQAGLGLGMLRAGGPFASKDELIRGALSGAMQAHSVVRDATLPLIVTKEVAKALILPAPEKFLIPISGPVPEKYEGYPQGVNEPLPIVWEHLLSGHPDPGVRQHNRGGLGVDFGGNLRTFYGLMQQIASDKKGNGWTAEPVEFILTRLDFAAPKSRGVQGIVFPDPRRTNAGAPLQIPVIYGKKGSNAPQFNREQAPKDIPMGYFWISGYWVFRVTKQGENPETFAIAIDGQVHNMSHAPFGKPYDEAIAQVRAKYDGDSTIPWFLTGKPHDGGPSMKAELLAARGGKIDIADYLKVRPDGKLDIPEQNIIPLWWYIVDLPEGRKR